MFIELVLCCGNETILHLEELAHEEVPNESDSMSGAAFRVVLGAASKAPTEPVLLGVKDLVPGLPCPGLDFGRGRWSFFFESNGAESDLLGHMGQATVKCKIVN